MGQAGSPAAPATDEAALPALPANLARVPAPYVAPPVNRKKPELVHVELEAKPVAASPMEWGINIGPIMALCLAR
jgi:hypothetical protein